MSLEPVNKNQPAYIIRETNAEKSIYESGAKSKATERLLLKGDDLRFAIDALEIKQSENWLVRAIKTLHAWCWFVKVNDINDREVYLNKSSLANRLMITKDKLSDLSQNHQLTTKWLSDRVEIVKKALDNAKLNAAEIEKTHRGLDIDAKERHALPIERIRLVSRIAFTQFHLNNPSLGKKGYEFRDGDDIFRAKIEKGKFHVIHMSTKTILGAGGAGVVTRVYDLTNAQFKAFKTLHVSDDRPLLVNRTVENFNVANPNGQFDYLALPPEVVFEDGIMTKEYMGGDLLLWLKNPNLNAFDLLNCCDQLINALIKMRTEAKLRHGDIKPANIVVDTNKDGSALFRIGDLDDTVRLTSENMEKSFYTTASFRTRDDRLDIRDAVSHKDFEAYVETTEQQDIFAMGLTLYTVLTKLKSSPFINLKMDGKSIIAGDFDSESLRNSLSSLKDEVAIDGIVRMVREMCRIVPDVRLDLLRLNELRNSFIAPLLKM